MTTEEIQVLNELPIDKLLRIKNSLQEVSTTDNITVTEPTFIETFGAQAMSLRSPIKRTDYEDGYKKEVSKISNIFSMSVTTLAFLAFGGYLLCLIVQAVKSKHAYSTANVPQSTLVLNAGIKRPQTFASYGRKKREAEVPNEIDLPPEQLFTALIQLCEGYAKWNGVS
ncbi:hypothetical protein RR48_14278 [Papilio machaon]|uniref:Uncharacterized protein n=1 Tax=Papilio machaon TaxID=76193 RepID=A0A194QMF4_PAPMA|nr:hypothetical protein RR48_14278 [Papilio machaon]